MSRIEFLRSEAELLRRRAEQARMMSLEETRQSYLKRAADADAVADRLEQQQNQLSQ